jgi:hypothetical protein
VRTPTAVLVRQVLGAIAQFDKATTVAKLKAARDRKIAAGQKCGGRKSYAERDPEMVDLARWLRSNVVEINGQLVEGRPHSLRKVAAELANRGYYGPGAFLMRQPLLRRCSAPNASPGRPRAGRETDFVLAGGVAAIPSHPRPNK